MKKKEPQVLVTTGIKGNQVYLTIDCPDALRAVLYLALIKAWLLDVCKKHPHRTQIVDREKGNGLN